YRRSLLLRLEHPHRSAVEDHVHRTARLGARRSINLRVGISCIERSIQSVHKTISTAFPNHGHGNLHICLEYSATQLQLSLLDCIQLDGPKSFSNSSASNEPRPGLA